MAFVYMKPRPFYIKSTPPIQTIDIVYYSISLTRVLYPGGLATTVEVGGREYQPTRFRDFSIAVASLNHMNLRRVRALAASESQCIL